MVLKGYFISNKFKIKSGRSVSWFEYETVQADEIIDDNFFYIL